MLLKMTTGLSGPDFNLSPGDKHEFDDSEAGRLIEAGFAEKADADAVPAEKRKKGKANVVSTSGDAGTE